MTTQNFLSVDITLSLTLEGFDGEEVECKRAILAEKGTPLPLLKKDDFVKGVKVPVNGKAYLILGVDNGGHRVIVEHKFRLKKSLFLVHGIKSIYNATQEALKDIPVVGKTIEKIAPDAKQKVDCVYEIEISPDCLMQYSVLVGRERKRRRSHVFEGEFLVSLR